MFGDRDDDEEDPAQALRELDAQKERKKAGLPILELDALPSSVAQKMMTLCCSRSFGGNQNCQFDAAIPSTLLVHS